MPTGRSDTDSDSRYRGLLLIRRSDRPTVKQYPNLNRSDRPTSQADGTGGDQCRAPARRGR
jgi:hypothetical protein